MASHSVSYTNIRSFNWDSNILQISKNKCMYSEWG